MVTIDELEEQIRPLIGLIREGLALLIYNGFKVPIYITFAGSDCLNVM